MRRVKTKEKYQELSSLVRKLRKAAHVHKHAYSFHASKAKKCNALINKFSLTTTMVGEASNYADHSCNYGRTITAAMRGFRGKKVRVTNLSNNKSVTVLINDYGPASWTGRVIDLSQASFARIAPLSQGIIPKVKLEIY
ncbi:MAG: hypothetical protein C4562_00120 [Actinobacteria bacterium]|nr:MAG: hypothetical protein C4562_00120 [Actinomycetota bacterium]